MFQNWYLSYFDGEHHLQPLRDLGAHFPTQYMYWKRNRRKGHLTTLAQVVADLNALTVEGVCLTPRACGSLRLVVLYEIIDC